MVQLSLNDANNSTWLINVKGLQNMPSLVLIQEKHIKSSRAKSSSPVSHSPVINSSISFTKIGKCSCNWFIFIHYPLIIQRTTWLNSATIGLESVDPICISKGTTTALVGHTPPTKSVTNVAQIPHFSHYHLPAIWFFTILDDFPS